MEKTIRLFTCMAQEDIPSDNHLKAALGAFQAYQVGPISGETGIPGLKIDFKRGLRIRIPKGNWHVRITDFDTETLFFDDDVSDLQLVSMEKYYIHWSIEIWKDGTPVFSHIFDPEGQEIFFLFAHTALGDNLAMLPYIRAFREKYHCKVSCQIPDNIRKITSHLYPEIPQVKKIPKDAYAVFYMCAWLTKLGLPVDLRAQALEGLGGSIVGLREPAPLPVFRPTCPRPVAEKYVCIALQASTQAKGWHYPGGWEIVVKHLKELGYRVFCIDRYSSMKEGDYITRMPIEAEDLTGDHDIMDRANMLYYAEFFIGLSSGLAWVANSVRCPVILISGITNPWCEFYTPYRILNRHVCHGCYNDIRADFKNNLCPYHGGTERELECSKKIAPVQVIKAINDLHRSLNGKCRVPQ